MLDAGILARYETLLRAEERRWPDWVAGQKAKIARALDALESEAASFGDTLDIGTIAVGCALGWLDFRYAADDWRAGRPALAAWFERFAARPSMATTVPREA
jgi:glutathione S-transferase